MYEDSNHLGINVCQRHHQITNYNIILSTLASIPLDTINLDNRTLPSLLGTHNYSNTETTVSVILILLDNEL